MCKYADLNNGECRISKEHCPYIYYCYKTETYKELNSMPSDCKVKKDFEVPKGAYKVCFERHHKLYVIVNNNVEIIDNPFDYTPLYVKMTKLKSGKWKIRQAVG